MTNETSNPENQDRIQSALMALITSVPASSCAPSASPRQEAGHLAHNAKMKAAGIAGALALPPGPLGLLTIIPDLCAIWSIQSQLVADIAAIYGKTSELKQEGMIYCLFRHGVASLGRDLLVRVGERVLIRRASLRFIQHILAQVGVRITQRVISKSISRWIPFIGAVAMAGYAWYDTDQVAETAIELFSQNIAIDETEIDAPLEPQHS